MITYAVFGGTFDPFTKAHEAIVKELIRSKLANNIIITPTVTNWYRNTVDTWLTDHERVTLCTFAAAKISEWRSTELPDSSYYTNIWCDWNDIHRKYALPEGELRDNFVKNHHFIDTLIDLQNRKTRVIDGKEYSRDGDNKWFTVIGSDQLKFFKNWYRWEDILKISTLVVVNNRHGEHVESDIPHIDIEIPDEFKNVSATELRKVYRDMSDGFQKYCKIFELQMPEKILYNGPIFTVVRKPDEHGIGFEPDGVNAPDWAAVIAEKDGKYATVTQLRYGLMKEFTEFPCGQVEYGEHPKAAAVRELEEETGIKVNIDDVMCLGSFAANPAFMNNYMHYFYVNLDTVKFETGSQKLDEHEKLKFEWVDKTELMKSGFEGCSVFMGGALLKLKTSNLA